MRQPRLITAKTISVDCAEISDRALYPTSVARGRAARCLGLTFPEVDTGAHPDASHGREVFRNPVLSLLAERRLLNLSAGVRAIANPIPSRSRISFSRFNRRPSLCFTLLTTFFCIRLAITRWFSRRRSTDDRLKKIRSRFLRERHRSL